MYEFCITTAHLIQLLLAQGVAYQKNIKNNKLEVALLTPRNILAILPQVYFSAQDFLVMTKLECPMLQLPGLLI
jgi:hypothetical protein